MMRALEMGGKGKKSITMLTALAKECLAEVPRLRTPLIESGTIFMYKL